MLTHTFLQFSPLRRMALAWLLLAAVGCGAGAQLAPRDGYRSQLGAQHPLVGRVYAVKQHGLVSSSELLDAAAQARYLVLGETHDNPDHHQLQAAVLQHFLPSQPSAAVAFEMLDEEDAGALTQVSTAEQLAERVDWAHSGWPEFNMYKPVFETALSAHARVVAAHPSSAHVHESMTGAPAADLQLDTPLPEAQVQAQREEIRESHCGHGNEAMLVAMQRAQVYKDAFMARAVASTGAPTALIAGRGHARNDRAVPYFLQRRKAGPSLSVAFVEVDDRRPDPSEYDSAAFDFVVFTPRVSDEDPCEKFRKQLEQMKHGE
jgi:uncharacterized iron-regulated protein